MPVPEEVARVVLPTPFGEFDTRAFHCSSGFVYLALLQGDVGGRDRVLTRLHSECLTGDALGSLRCDCGVQLKAALRAIASEGTGAVVYATGQEGRGIGLVNKLRAYIEQDGGADTVDANVRLGLPVDARGWGDAAAVVSALGIRSVRLMTNNPAKAEGLRLGGVDVAEVVPLPIAAHARNIEYLTAKTTRLGHAIPSSADLPAVTNGHVPQVGELAGEVRPRTHRPYVIVKYAQTLDGRIATATGDSRWISGETERRISHALRAACDAVLVGIGTVLRDDPQLTVRMVPGASPLRVVLDSSLRIPADAQILDDEAATTVLTTPSASPSARLRLSSRHVGVRVVPSGPGGVDVTAALRLLRSSGVRSLLVEGGARVITSMLEAGVVDRLIVGVAPLILGAGTEAIGDLRVSRVTDGLRLRNRSVHLAGEDVLLAWDVCERAEDVERAGAGS